MKRLFAVGAILRRESPQMSGKLTVDQVQECYRRAAEARRMAEAPGVTLAERADLFDVERRWLSLAQRYGSEQSVDN